MPFIDQHRPGRRTATPLTPEPPLSAAELATELAIDSTRAGHVLAAVWALVHAYAPSAPVALQREAVIRCAGWIADSPRDNLRAEIVGPFEAQYAASQTGAMLHSGAKGLLYPWRMKMAGIAV